MPHFRTEFYLPECKGLATSVHHFYRQVFPQSLAAATGFKNTKILQFKVSIDNFMHSAMTALDLKPMKLLPK